MKAPAGALVTVAISVAGCSSRPQTVSRKPQHTDENTRHWSGSTEILKTYRLPDSSTARQRSADFGFSKQKQPEKEERQHK